MYGDHAIRSDTWRTLFPPDSVFSYQGRCPGFNVYMCRDLAHDVDVVVLCNNYAGGMVGTIGTDFLELGRGLKITNPRWRADLSVDTAQATAWSGAYGAPAGKLPYGDGPFEVRRHNGELVLYLDRTPVDVLVPQGGGAFLLRNLWSEMRFVAGASGQPPHATLLPLWFKTDPVVCERLSEPSQGR